MKEKINYNIFYITDKDDKIYLSDEGIILSNRTIVLKQRGSIRPKIIFDSELYGKNILDVYQIFFEYGLDIEHNRKVVEYFNKKSHKFFRRKNKEEHSRTLKLKKYLFKYEVVDDEKFEENPEENYHKVKVIRR